MTRELQVETNRLLLRVPIADDFPVYCDFFADAEASKFYNGPLSPDAAWRVLASDVGHWQMRGYGRWSIIEKGTGTMLGSCGLWWPGGYPRSELTWWIVPQGRRRGIAYEASQAAIRFGYDQLSWAIIETHMDDSNVAARRLAEKLGGTIISREKFPDGVTRNVFGLPRPSVV